MSREQFRGLLGLVLFQLLHSLQEVLHSPVHICPCGATPHAQPQCVLCHLWGNPTAQQHWGGPGTQPGGGGWTPRQRKPNTSAGTLTESQEEPHLFTCCPLHSPLFAFQGHPISLGLLPYEGSGSFKKNLFHVPVGWQLCHIHRALL